jgi:uncharacterized protein (TIGR02391 family)
MQRPFPLSVDDVLTLPVDDVALEILRDVIANPAWGTHDWIGIARVAFEQEDRWRSGAAVRAIEEAWAWLYRKGLVAISWQTPPQFGPFFVTRAGEAVAREGLAPVRAAERLDVDLHLNIVREARPQFLMGKFELAAFAAMRQVEIRMRDLSEAEASLVGVPLARFAWRDDGPLADMNVEAGERLATAHLFAGAMGVFKNPPSHRIVEFEDPTLAAEVVLLADLLMRILDDAAQRIEEP